MNRYELSISENYVSNWGVVEAVREIFQNALDQETQFEDNKMFYNMGADHISIGNKSSRLNIESLLLGESSKRDDASTIGKFGEGYKLALLVLTRLGKKVKIYNYQAREVWEAKLRPSKRYNNVKTLVIEVQDKYIWQRVPNNDLTYVIDGLTVEERVAIALSNLHLQAPEEVIETERGRVLLDKKQAGRVYVRGLFVGEFSDLKYGYDIKPQYLDLDRDRRSISHFDLTWTTSSMWKSIGGRRLIDLCMQGDVISDVRYLPNAPSGYYDKSSGYADAAEDAYLAFKEEHGSRAFPVATQKDMESLKKRTKELNPIIVSSSMQTLLAVSTKYCEEWAGLPPEEEEQSPFSLLSDFYDKVTDSGNLSETEMDLLNTILEKSKKWRIM